VAGAASAEDAAGAAPLAAAFVAQGDKNSDQRLSKGRIRRPRRRLVRQARYRERWQGGPGGIRSTVRRRDPAPAGASGGRRLDLRTAPSRLHRLLEPAGVYAAWSRQPGGHLAGVQQDDRRVLQVALEQPAGDHLQGRRPKSPINAPFQKLKGPLVVNDETYTMGHESFSRQNVRVLTSVDYSKMCDEDKQKELNPRADHDYA
jgi:hypothetical protein